MLAYTNFELYLIYRCSKIYQGDPKHLIQVLMICFIMRLVVDVYVTLTAILGRFPNKS